MKFQASRFNNIKNIAKSVDPLKYSVPSIFWDSSRKYGISFLHILCIFFFVQDENIASKLTRHSLARIRKPVFSSIYEHIIISPSPFVEALGMIFIYFNLIYLLAFKYGKKMLKNNIYTYPTNVLSFQTDKIVQVSAVSILPFSGNCKWI